MSVNTKTVSESCYLDNYNIELLFSSFMTSISMRNEVSDDYSLNMMKISNLCLKYKTNFIFFFKYLEASAFKLKKIISIKILFPTKFIIH